MLTFVASPYALTATCSLPISAFMAFWTQATLPLPTCVTDCASAGTAAANTMATIAANNITFFNSTSSFDDCLYTCRIFSSLPHNVNTVVIIFYHFLKTS
jgi:hypothetical protein